MLDQNRHKILCQTTKKIYRHFPDGANHCSQCLSMTAFIILKILKYIVLISPGNMAANGIRLLILADSSFSTVRNPKIVSGPARLTIFLGAKSPTEQIIDIFRMHFPST